MQICATFEELRKSHFFLYKGSRCIRPVKFTFYILGTVKIEWLVDHSRCEQSCDK